MKNLFFTIIVLVSLITLSPAFGGSLESNKIFKSIKDPSEGEKFIAQLAEDRSETIKNIIAIIENNSIDTEIRIRAIKIVELCRPAEAVPSLISNLESIRPRVVQELTHESSYPCIRGLIAIGKEGATGALNSIIKCENDKKVILFCGIVA